MPRLLTTCVVSLVVFIVLVITEHVCHVSGFETKPSLVLNLVVKYSQDLFEYLGRIAALISSFYVKLRLEELLVSAWAITKELLNLCASPFYFVYGYFDASILYNNPILIYGGSATIVLIVLGLAAWWFKFNPFKFIRV